MERLPSDDGRRRRLVRMQCPPPGRVLAVPPMVRAPPPNQAKLAAIAVDLNIRLRSAEMPGAMQERAFRCTRAVLDANLEKKLNPTHIAMCLKKEFDAVYGPAWHCIVGKSFGSFVTHSSGGFVYFSVDKLSFLLFKTEVRPVRKPLPLPPPLLKLNIND
ncbi:dynein light chain, cytoplasmic [Ricinus communis]|uniref:Dynein light chain n=1 Tax=Ricinus communis TaxID=3988 RepID=B9R9T3_RICCO|nr:dynein light chain, cytoplasmic [Ricinus communis]EEF51560.1 axonemal dynein light chain, putative [Ricinus communis]|eukprot:XP_002510958.1 dynein light chain, cytoplasmic [Ricinus communis]